MPLKRSATLIMGAALGAIMYFGSLMITAYHNELCATKGRFAEGDPSYHSELTLMPAGYRCTWLSEQGSPTEIVRMETASMVGMAGLAIAAICVAGLIALGVAALRRRSHQM